MILSEQIKRMRSLAGINENELENQIDDNNNQLQSNVESNPTPTSVDSNAEDGTVEIDVTTMVNKAEENSIKLDDVSQQLQQLKDTMNNITTSLVDMNSIKDSIDKVRDDLSNKIRQANPTPMQKLQIRGALDTGSYGISVGDYWKGSKPANYQIDVIDQINVDGSTYNKGGAEEYVITDLDIAQSHSMSDFNIYNSYY